MGLLVAQFAATGLTENDAPIHDDGLSYRLHKYRGVTG